MNRVSSPSILKEQKKKKEDKQELDGIGIKRGLERLAGLVKDDDSVAISKLSGGLESGLGVSQTQSLNSSCKCVGHLFSFLFCVVVSFHFFFLSHHLVVFSFKEDAEGTKVLLVSQFLSFFLFLFLGEGEGKKLTLCVVVFCVCSLRLLVLV